MNVADLQRHLSSLAELVDRAGGGKAAAELRASSAGLEPFASHSFADFAAFLRLANEIAEEFRRTGQVPIPPVKTKRAPRKLAVKKPSIEECQARIRGVYDSAPTAAFSIERLDAEMAAISSLTVAELKSLAGEVDSGGAVRSIRKKQEILDTIRKAILDRRASMERVAQ